MNETLNYFLPYQQRWIDDPSPFSLGEKSRRIGWTYASSYRAVERRVRQGSKRSLYFSSADQTAGREFIDYCKTWCEVFNTVAVESDEVEVIDDREMNTKVLTFANGTKIVAGSSNPVFFRSKGGDTDGDEFAFHRDGRELVKAMHATSLFWGHQLRLWSTHNGDGSYFHSLLKDARSGKLKAAVHRVTLLDAVDQGLVEKIKRLKARDDRARQEWLDDLRSTCPDEATWNEEYLCQPQSEANSLISYELIRGCEMNPDDQKIVEDPRELRLTGPGYVGFDVGREKDLSVFWVLELIGDVYWTRLVKRFHKTPYQTQLDYGRLLMEQPNVRRMCGDATGIGDMLIESLQNRVGKARVEKVKFTADVKADLAMPLVALFEDRRVRVPADAATREGLHKVRKIVTSAGNVRFDAAHDDAGHADEFWSCGLAYHAADRRNAGPRVRKSIAQLPAEVAA